ncbi:hypothetical protein ACLKA6_000663 [Drosophila palustris]
MYTKRELLELLESKGVQMGDDVSIQQMRAAVRKICNEEDVGVNEMAEAEEEKVEKGEGNVHESTDGLPASRGVNISMEDLLKLMSMHNKAETVFPESLAKTVSDQTVLKELSAYSVVESEADIHTPMQFKPLVKSLIADYQPAKVQVQPVVELKIVPDGQIKPFRQQPSRHTPVECAAIQKQVEEWLEAGIVRKSTSNRKDKSTMKPMVSLVQRQNNWSKQLKAATSSRKPLLHHGSSFGRSYRSIQEVNYPKKPFPCSKPGTE